MTLGWRKFVVVLVLIATVAFLDYTGHPLSANALDALGWGIGLFFGANTAEHWAKRGGNGGAP